MEKKQLIYDTAKAIFSEKGFKDTNISAVTRAANMAVGTFYLYFSSKEQLFIEIFKEENAKLKQRVFDTLDLTESPSVIIHQMLRLNYAGINESPILREWYHSEDFRKIERLYREEHAIETLDFLYEAFLQLVRRWQTEGKIRADIDSVMIMKVFESIVNIDTHKDEIGLEYFPQLLDLLTDLLLKGLTDCTV